MKERQKKNLISAGLLLAGAGLAYASTRVKDKLLTVQFVDLNRYQGVWYEIAAFPKRYEKNCGSTRAEYTLIDAGTAVRVRNFCTNLNSEAEPIEEMIEGKACPVKGSNNAKLKVQFYWPFKGDYWILELDPAYSHAVVGSPDRKSLWILSREPQMDEATYTMLAARAAAKGFNVSRLRKTSQASAQPTPVHAAQKVY